jgi:uncharacterized protein
MSSILILSDTHGNQKLLRSVLENQISETDYLFHLGDNYEDLDEHKDLLNTVIVSKVPGIFHKGYINKTIPIRQNVTVKGWKFLLVHNIDDVPPILTDVNIVCFGHTHQQMMAEKEDVHYINPGHLKSNSDRGRLPTYAVLAVEEDKITVCFKDTVHQTCRIEKISRYRD